MGDWLIGWLFNRHINHYGSLTWKSWLVDLFSSMTIFISHCAKIQIFCMQIYGFMDIWGRSIYLARWLLVMKVRTSGTKECSNRIARRLWFLLKWIFKLSKSEMIKSCPKLYFSSFRIYRWQVNLVFLSKAVFLLVILNFKRNYADKTVYTKPFIQL